MRELGLEEESKELTIPCEKGVKVLEEEEEYLDGKGSTKYRGMTARLNYLSQDRTDIQYAVKELSKCMANPSVGAMRKLKRAARYLKGAPRYILKYAYQSKPEGLGAWADTDFAGCQITRKSTSGGIIMHGEHVIKSWSTNQAVIALSSGEAEYYGPVSYTHLTLPTNREV